VESLHTFAIWLKSTDLSWSVTHHAWVWATCEALQTHFDEKLERLPDCVRPESMDGPHFPDTYPF
jgi:hypothetical protein